MDKPLFNQIIKELVLDDLALHKWEYSDELFAKRENIVKDSLGDIIAIKGLDKAFKAGQDAQRKKDLDEISNYREDKTNDKKIEISKRKFLGECLTEIKRRIKE